ncbi:MAG: hypothetical protein ACI4TA_10090 [Acetatifactor sp.]
MELSIAFLQLFSEMWSVGYRYALRLPKTGGMGNQPSQAGFVRCFG